MEAEESVASAPPPAAEAATPPAPPALPPPVAMEPALADMIVSEYEGDRDNEGRFHGMGEATFKGGHSYRGAFVHGVMHGDGRYVWANGTVFEGGFKQNEVCAVVAHHTCIAHYFFLTSRPREPSIG